MSPLHYLVIALLILMPASSQAQGVADGDRLTFSGFGTLGLIHNSSDEAAFVRDLGQPKGAQEGWSARTDSLLGAQAALKLNDRFDVTLQGISRYHYSGDFSPQLTWAFVRYTPSPAWQWRAGRLGWDTYMLSDSQYVGYTYSWIRPPVDHYGILQLACIDGVDVTFRHPLGGGLAWVKLFAGRSDSHLVLSEALSAEMEVSHLYGGHLNYAIGPWQFRASYAQADNASDFSVDRDAAAKTPSTLLLNTLLEQAFTYDSIQLYSLGATYEQNSWQLQAMQNRSVTDQDGRIDSGFISAGYRVGQATPYVMYSRIQTSFPDIPAGESFRQQTWSLGLRYDVATNLALKTQLDRIHVLEPGLLWRNTDADWEGERITLVSLGLDFIF
ncbi:porin [Kushneria phosphatilytica]|nr:porin [Kushneria phosphatilytica]